MTTMKRSADPEAEEDPDPSLGKFIEQVVSGPTQKDFLHLELLRLSGRRSRGPKRFLGKRNYRRARARKPGKRDRAHSSKVRSSDGSTRPSARYGMRFRSPTLPLCSRPRTWEFLLDLGYDSMSLKSARVASERPCDPGRANHVWEPGDYRLNKLRNQEDGKDLRLSRIFLINTFPLAAETSGEDGTNEISHQEVNKI
ncbi:unnamed protein product (mitochondrion) [Arabidopsis thaliana]|uniref:(thale cress) hypothetical protein n=1 Tax=Arabidopsis thaliana TaxID=3702 RepID=A0A7G2FJP9_ARATH|nr:unnamed protein product [Arabidopsis thaliana]